MANMNQIFGSMKNALSVGNFTLPGLVQTLQTFTEKLENAEGGGGSSSIYSTNEIECGTWIDGRKVFVKTYVFDSAISCTKQTWTNTGIIKGTMGTILQAQVIATNGTICAANVKPTNNISIYNAAGEDITVKYLVIQYVKNEAPQQLHLIQYIEGNGSQWIDTGINEGGVYGVEFEFTPSSLVTDYQSYLSGTVDNFTVGSTLALDKPYVRFRTNELTTTTISLSSKNTLTILDTKETINGVDVATVDTSKPVSTASALNIYIFNNPAGSRSSAMKLYGLKLYGSTGNLIFDGKPAKDSDEITCLYDAVSASYIYNSGLGNFTPGPDLLN